MVIDVSKKFLPGVAIGWNDPRVKLHCGDASLFIQRPECQGYFDVIISDTSDPVGMRKVLHSSFLLPAHFTLSCGCVSQVRLSLCLKLHSIAI